MTPLFVLAISVSIVWNIVGERTKDAEISLIEEWCERWPNFKHIDMKSENDIDL